MKYLKKFNQHTDYETYMGSQDLIYPNVSYCVDRNEVHFNPDPYNGHKFVDLGLPSGTKWATMNVGAVDPNQFGLYFQWGDTQGYFYPQGKSFTQNDYKFWSNNSFTKYNQTDGKSVLDPEDDAAYVNWGESWRMPLPTHFNELFNNNNTTREMISDYVVKITSKSNNNFILLPVHGGYINNGSFNDTNNGFYWTCNPYGFISNGQSSSIQYYGNYRHFGFLVRPIVYQSEAK